MWSLEFVEVADDELMTKKSSDRSLDTLSHDTGVDVAEKSSSQPLDIPSSLSSRRTNLTTAEYSSSLDSETGHMQCAVDNWLSAEKLSCDDTASTSHATAANTDRHQQSRDTPLSDTAAAESASEMFMMDDEDESQMSTTPAAAAHVLSAARSDTLSSIPTVSIDTPESGEFCFVTEQDISESQLMTTGFQRRKLRDGFHWQKQLVFRSKLTMHTAFERKDNKDPAAVTALAVSRYSLTLMCFY